VSVRIASALSTAGDPRAGAADAAGKVAAELAGAPIDVAFVFAAGAHLAEPEATLEAVHDALSPRELVGCAAGGVVADGQEVEHGTAVAVWAAALGGGSASTFHAEVTELEQGVAISGMPELAGASAAFLLPDPFSFPTDAVLAELHGLVAGGAVGVRLDGVELLPCVSQGATPVGPELTITAGAGRIINELAGRPALVALREVIEGLPPAEREVLSEGILLGIVVEHGQPEYVHGDFLVRSVLGGDPDHGTIAVGAPISPGQVVRVHVRDARSADRDLREALELRRQALGSDAPAGALIFTCNGRGRGMFGVSGHDARAVSDELGRIPVAGFFAAGEIGPVGGQSFVHGFTATVALFAP
jgi:small ligand-binding sensory domain FIST